MNDKECRESVFYSSDKVNKKFGLNTKGQMVKLIHNSIIAKPTDITGIASFMIITLEKLYANGNTVVVTDNYLFKPTNDSQYEHDLKLILKSLSASKVIHYGEDKNINKKLFNSVKEYLKQNETILTHKNLSDFHDRFWITKETNKGVVIGTSLNGIGKKIFYYNEIKDEESVEVLRYLSE